MEVSNKIFFQVIQYTLPYYTYIHTVANYHTIELTVLKEMAQELDLFGLALPGNPIRRDLTNASQ